MSDRTGHVLAAIDGALADAELPDAMRWSPDPAKAAAPHPYDGSHVPLPPQRYERPWEPPRMRRTVEPVYHSQAPALAAARAAEEQQRAESLPRPILSDAQVARLRLLVRERGRGLTVTEVAALRIAADPDALDRMVQAMAEALRPAIEAFAQSARDVAAAFRQATPQATPEPPGEGA